MAICKNCGKEFKKRVKDPRKTCSLECYKARKSSRSKDDSVRELARVINSKIAGQTSLDTRIIPGDIKTTSSCCYVEDSWLSRIKNLVKRLFYNN